MLGEKEPSRTGGFCGEKEGERASKLTSQYGCNFARMARDRYVGTSFRRKDVVKDPLRPDVLVRTRLAVESYP